MDRNWTKTGPKLSLEVDLLTRRPVDWFLLSGSRLAVSAGLLGVVAAVLWWVVLSGVAPLEERTAVLFLAFALIGGNFTLITIVVSISQFVLARHLESPGEIREQMREIAGYRQEVGEVTRESVIPVTPGGFFRLIFGSIDRDIHDLQDREWDPSEADFRRDVEDLVGDLEEHAEHVMGLLDRGDAGVRYALFSVLDTNYAQYFYRTYQVRAEHHDEMPAPVADTLNGLERHVEQVDVARRYFKTVFIQSQLSALSRRLLYIGVPVQVVSVVLMLAFTATTSPSLTLLRVVIPAVVTAGFAPIVLLTAYILRLTTVVQRTAAMYPFTTGDRG